MPPAAAPHAASISRSARVLVRGLRRGRSSASSTPATLIRNLELHATQLKLEPLIRANERERLLDQGDTSFDMPSNRILLQQGLQRTKYTPYARRVYNDFVMDLYFSLYSGPQSLQCTLSL